MTERPEAALLVLVLQLGAEALLVNGEDAEHTAADSVELLVLAGGSWVQAGAPPWRMDLCAWAATSSAPEFLLL